MAEHHIETGQVTPVCLPPYRIPHAFRETVQQELKEMLDHGVIEKSCSDWAALSRRKMAVFVFVLITGTLMPCQN